MRGGISLATLPLPSGTVVHVQLVCRPEEAGPVMVGRTGYGSAAADRMRTRRLHSTLLGGLGDDLLRITRLAGSAFGGPGDDRVVLDAPGAASGGPGNDVIRSTTRHRTLLVGGAGRDRLIGGLGHTLIDAADGRGGDTVHCRSGRTQVRADAGDRLIGTCIIAEQSRIAPTVDATAQGRAG